MDLGIQPLDRVLVQLPNWNEFVFAYFALQKIGAIPVLLIDRYRQFEINHLISLTGATSGSSAIQEHGLPPHHPRAQRTSKVKKVITVRGKGDPKPFVSLETLIDKAELTEDNLARLAGSGPTPAGGPMGPTGGRPERPRLSLARTTA
jgi:2,3-dihydroxybenzoate-AMP ligase/mycobactin salicyl-AMP ligase